MRLSREVLVLLGHSQKDKPPTNFLPLCAQVCGKGMQGAIFLGRVLSNAEKSRV
jgi:hypothetical protein